MERLQLQYTPRFDQATIEKDLHSLLVSGPIADKDIDGRITRLAERYRTYTRYYPYGLWAPGLVITREMRLLTEIYLPVDNIRRAFDRFFSLALRFRPFIPASTVHNSDNWLDILRLLLPTVSRTDPANMLRTLLADDGMRRCFIFSNFMPLRYGSGFGRYPGQGEFLRKWLVANRTRLAGVTRCLDVACSSGEGTYDLALLLIRSGFGPDSIEVRGVTMEPLELFSAAHACFPHNPEREASYRRHVRPLFESGAVGKICFSLEDISMPPPEEIKGYDIILCNGLLGGPFLHDPVELADTVRRLSERLRSGGIMLAASRFHGGWKKLLTDEALRKLFGACGLVLQPIAEGVAGVRLKNEA
jgi:hypothetical protein